MTFIESEHPRSHGGKFTDKASTLTDPGQLDLDGDDLSDWEPERIDTRLYELYQQGFRWEHRRAQVIYLAHSNVGDRLDYGRAGTWKLSDEEALERLAKQTGPNARSIQESLAKAEAGIEATKQEAEVDLRKKFVDKMSREGHAKADTERWFDQKMSKKR